MKHAMLATAIGTTLAIAATANAQTLSSLGVPPGWTESSAMAVSDDGMTVVGFGLSAAGLRSFRWTAAGGFVDVTPFFGGEYPQARGISPNGTVAVGTVQTAEGQRAFRWTAGGGMQNLGVLPRGTSSHANAVSGENSVVVGSHSSDEGMRAFRWTSATGIQELGVLPGTSYSVAYGVSANGGVIVGVSGDEAFRWTSRDGMVQLDRLPGGITDSAEAYAVNADGSVVVGWSEGVAFRWTADRGMQSLGLLPESTATAGEAVSGDGRTVGGASVDPTTPVRAILWRESIGMVDLKEYLTDIGANTAGWQLHKVKGVSYDGRTIVGFGTLGGQKRAFRVTGLPKACRADMNGDGVLNIFDFLEFQNLFAAGDPRADFNYDGLFDIFDFLEFQNAFAAGCP